ncbi:ubiquitinyl hydrolase 1 [Ancylostoma ceylanicum]|uniref:Ubiquitin carboxyl-terminal hydrolase n=1 Tax=Ancylostoma ceylanicum TaxID=53326 RepID=A0A0D6M6B9_9BILA|nr:ubiquitinyl hydrolase 1 [Ancylostoma ceylanicum]
MGRRRSGRKSTRTSECLPKDQNANIPVATNNCDEQNYLSKCNHLNVIGKLSREKIHSAAQNNPAHCILWNLRNSRLYCMQCAAEVYKDANYPPLDAEIRRALMPLKRSHRQSSSTPSQEVQNKKEVSHRRTEPTQTRGRCIESFAVVNRPLAKDMEDGFDFDFPKGLTGLFNLGNTCYFNAAIQVLSNCPPFSDYFRDKGDLRPYATREPLVSNTMALLIQKLWSAKREPAVFPKALLTRVRDNFPQFRGWNQQDAQELIRFETADSGWSSDGDTTCTSTDSRRSCAEKVEKQKASNMPVRWRSIVTDVFDGSIESSVTCLTCKTVSTTTETFQDLSLPIPSAEHLSRIRQSSSGESDVDDGSASDLSSGYGVSTRVSFPLVELDLSPFSSTSEKVPLYDLTGFITHEGSGADSGHYLAYCRNEVDGNWYEYDDSTLTKLDSAHVLTKEAYVLLYQKRPSLSVEAARNKTMEMISAEEIVKAQSKSQLYISSEWLLKLSTFSDPGPVTNYSFLCRHGHLLPRRVDHISSLCTPVPAVLGHYLLNKFGGGPAVSELHYCLVCDKHWRWLQEKRAVEQTRFRQLEDAVRATLFAGAVEALYSGHLPPSLISRTWFQSWEKFISQPCSEPPGPIDNTVLLYKAADGTDRLKPRSNFMRIERELYLFLRTIYGGGPEVFLTDQPQWSEAELRDVLNAVDEKLWAANAKLKKHVTSNL